MNHLKSLIAVTILIFANFSVAADFDPNSLLVFRVGDGTNTLTNSVGPISILEVSKANGSILQTINIPTTALQVSGSATSEGAISLSSDRRTLTIGGYLPPFTGSGSLGSRTAAQAPRAFVTMDSTGTISPTTTLTNFYSTDNIRSGVAAGAGNYYFTGSSGPGSGIMFSGSSGTNQIADINSRQIQVRNGNLLYSTGSGTRGIYSFNGLPTSTTNASSLLTGVTGQGTSPYDFTFSPDGNTLYVADDGIGVQRFNFSNGSWTHAYNLTNGLTSGRAFGLHVDFGSSSNDVFWTSASDTGVNSIW